MHLPARTRIPQSSPREECQNPVRTTLRKCGTAQHIWVGPGTGDPDVDRIAEMLATGTERLARNWTAVTSTACSTAIVRPEICAIEPCGWALPRRSLCPLEVAPRGLEGEGRNGQRGGSAGTVVERSRLPPFFRYFRQFRSLAHTTGFKCRLPGPGPRCHTSPLTSRRSRSCSRTRTSHRTKRPLHPGEREGDGPTWSG